MFLRIDARARRGSRSFDTFTRDLRTAAPYQQAYRSRPSEGRFYGLQFADWPADIQAGWEQWRDLVCSRSRANSRASSRLRETTVKSDLGDLLRDAAP